jgi:hypothetical protein
MHGPINVKSPNNISKWQMGFNSAFEGLKGAEEISLNAKKQTQTESISKQVNAIPKLDGKRKVKVQTLRLCTGCTVYRESRGIAILFPDHRH